MGKTKKYKDKPSQKQKGKEKQIQRKTHKGTAAEEVGRILTLSQTGKNYSKVKLTYNDIRIYKDKNKHT